MIGHKLTAGQKLHHKYAGKVVVIEDEDDSFFVGQQIGREEETMRLHKIHVRQVHDSH